MRHLVHHILRRLAPGAAVLICVAALAPVRAEVSAELDATGQYIRTVIFSNASVKNLKIWGVQRSRSGYVPLNPDGDLNGDLWPVIREDLSVGSGPWVVWSRFNGLDFDLAWARWEGAGWSEIAWLETVPSGPGDDLSPDLKLDSQGRPFTVWWRDEAGVGQVYLSLFLSSRWSTPYRVSSPDVDSRYPVLEILDDATLRITFETPDGTRSRTVTFARPDTITDDLNPFQRMTLSEEDPGGGESLSR